MLPCGAGELRLMSEQYLMDCSWPFGNTGCNGGYQETAFAFILANGGIAANADYPYHGVNMACRNDTPLAAALEGFVSVPPYNKTLLQEALLTRGPMAVSINADDPGFKFYRSGAGSPCWLGLHSAYQISRQPRTPHLPQTCCLQRVMSMHLLSPSCCQGRACHIHCRQVGVLMRRRVEQASSTARTAPPGPHPSWITPS